MPGKSETADGVPENPIVKVPATSTTLAELAKKANRAPNAKDALQLYSDFVQWHEFTTAQSKKFKEQQQLWQQRTEQRLVRLGRKWVSPEKAQAASDEADSLIAQAREMIKVRDFKGAERALKTANRVDPNGIRAPFTLGLLNSLYSVTQLQKNAERYFATALDRSPNHIAVLNNLALSEMKLRKFRQAALHWRQAVELSPKTPEITQNLGRLISEASQNKLDVPKGLLASLSQLYAETTASGKGKPADLKVGWLYSHLILPKTEKKREQKSKTTTTDRHLVAASSGTGFVIHGAFIMTNRHVVDDKSLGVADKIKIVDPNDAKHERELEAKLVATSTDLDLAILKCDPLKAPPLRMSAEIPRRGTEIMVLGFPMGEAFGRSLKSTRGAISALPDLSNGNMIVYDATTNPGNSGGPVCNSRGILVAVHSTGFLFSGKLAGGVPSKNALPFIQKYISGFSAKPNAGPKLEWPDVDQRASKSTVMIINYYERNSLGLAIAANTPQDKKNYIEDKSCSVCNGFSHLPCNRRGCSKGRISVRIPFKQTVRDFKGQVRGTITKYRKEYKRCPTCGGKNRVDCRFCSNGRDPNLR